MIGSLASPYPLKSTTDAELQKLTQALWNWNICEACQKAEACTNLECSWRRSARLEHFFDFYKYVTSSYVPDLLPASTPALRNHEDVCDIINLLQAHPDVKRSELMHEYFSKRDKPPSSSDQHWAFNLAMQVMSMVKCSAENQPSSLLELGAQAFQWHSDESPTGFISRAFPQKDTGNLHVHDDSGEIRDIKPALTARRLKKVAGLRLQGTDDLRNHLRMDVKRGVVEIYHYTSVLREHLAASRTLPSISAQDPSFGEICNSPTAGTNRLNLRGNIPRQIALEALDSMQKILFPFDSDSEQILCDLVSKESFDPDCLRYDSAVYRREGEEAASYNYFGSRLVDLFKELEDPSPRGILEKWLQRKSGARYMMMATLVGVIIAIILGILGLAVGVFQAWVSYEAWKHPVSSRN
ncbi:uncharacterized protein Triagg1_10 [Trichoderma aggressivum f. europaeum]|uniref:Uncharacterized protein n=1 Tax=Trichoderma aggressivum f. europaeum TaxID=173218 RepID=A0AAE1ILD7_9HYPO|nr:hypothetical protein Triagg1_10 [Trichoderma aggressivum f. europaeum]